MIESLTVLADGSLLGRLARDPGHNLGRVLGKVRFRGNGVVGPAAFLADGEQTGGGEDAEMLGRGGRREGKEFLNLANAEFAAL